LSGEGAYPLVQLRYVAKTGTGHTPSRSRPDLWVDAERTIPWMTLADVGPLRAGTVDVVTETVERITPAGIASSSAVIHPAGTVFLSRTASVGFSALMGQAMAVSQDFMTWTPGPLLDGRFLLHVLRGMRPELLGLMHGSTHKTIYMPDLLSLRAPLPPLQQQRAIAAFLDRECERIAELDTRLVGLTGAGTALALARFADAIAPFRSARVGYYFEVQLGKMLDEKRIELGTRRPYLRNTNVQWDRVDVDDLKTMAFLPGEEVRYGVRKGDLLVCEGGDPGRCAVWPGPEGMFIQKALLRVRPRERASVRYLLWMLRLCHARGDFKAGATGATILHLPAERLRATHIPMPSDAAQHEIAGVADQLARRSTELDAAVHAMRHRLVEYRDALIAEAVTGQLDVTVVSEAQMDERAHAAAEGVVAAGRAPAQVG
jgi:type I restriction enzyme S subunit